MPYVALLVIALFAYTLVDVVATDQHLIRNLPKPLWTVVVLAPIAGPIAWLLLGRPRGASLLPGATGQSSEPARRTDPRHVVAPDDDPEFLRRLGDPRDDR